MPHGDLQNPMKSMRAPCALCVTALGRAACLQLLHGVADYLYLDFDKSVSQSTAATKAFSACFRPASRSSGGSSIAIRWPESQARLNSTKVSAVPEWLHEIKHDGFRIRVERDGDWVRLITRPAMTGAGAIPRSLRPP